MSNDNYLKCRCKECGNNIEFAGKSAGTVVPCPHCGQWTELLTDQPVQTSGSKGISLGLLALIGCVLLATAAGGFFFWQSRNQAASPPPPVPIPVKVAIVPTNPPPPKPATNPPPVTEKRPKSPDDLKAGPVQLERSKGSSLVYAVGSVTNDSEYQRFGVRVEMDLFSPTGKKLGTAKDYKDVIEPHREWQFHALTLNSKATTAKVSLLTEE